MKRIGLIFDSRYSIGGGHFGDVLILQRCSKEKIKNFFYIQLFKIKFCKNFTKK